MSRQKRYSTIIKLEDTKNNFKEAVERSIEYLDERKIDYRSVKNKSVAYIINTLLYICQGKL